MPKLVKTWETCAEKKREGVRLQGLLFLRLLDISSPSPDPAPGTGDVVVNPQGKGPAMDAPVVMVEAKSN